MSTFHLNPMVTSVEQLEVHYVNSFFAILPTVLHRPLCAADANLMLQNTRVSVYLEKILSLALYFIPVSTDCMMSRFYRRFIFTVTYILVSQRSLNATVEQPKNCSFVVNTAVELKNIKRLHSTKTALSSSTGVIFRLSSVPVLSGVVAFFYINRNINSKWANFGLCRYFIQWRTLMTWWNSCLA